jgi:hypothetical protein
LPPRLYFTLTNTDGCPELGSGVTIPLDFNAASDLWKGTGEISAINYPFGDTVIWTVSVEFQKTCAIGVQATNKNAYNSPVGGQFPPGSVTCAPWIFCPPGCTLNLNCNPFLWQYVNAQEKGTIAFGMILACVCIGHGDCSPDPPGCLFGVTVTE